MNHDGEQVTRAILECGICPAGELSGICETDADVKELLFLDKSQVSIPWPVRNETPVSLTIPMPWQSFDLVPTDPKADMMIFPASIGSEGGRSSPKPDADEGF